LIREELTDEERQEDLERQYDNLRADPATVIFCPWCHKTNKLGSEPCCGLFTEGVEKIGQRQFQSIVNQWREMKLGSRRTIKCPYCGQYNRKAEENQHPADWIRPMVSPFCCQLFQDAAIAIAEREALHVQIDQKKRIEDGVVEEVLKAGRN
jgi:uncharacterized Zn-finger protein